MIKVGMFLLCMYQVDIGPGSEGKLWVKDVPVKVLHITKDKQAMVEFDFTNVKNLKDITVGKFKEIVPVENLQDPEYMNCKKRK